MAACARCDVLGRKCAMCVFVDTQKTLKEVTVRTTIIPDGDPLVLNPYDHALLKQHHNSVAWYIANNITPVFE